MRDFSLLKERGVAEVLNLFYGHNSYADYNESPQNYIATIKNYMQCM